jgi:tetratricopeptide (TPR) repeat protein
VGSTAVGEQLDPEDLQALLSRYHGYVRGELERRGGTVEKFIGDAVVALFGAPVAHEDDPERAVRASLAVREWVLEQPDLHVRMAVNTGEALVMLGARAAQGEHLASGDVLNAAARLQAAAPVDGILVGEQTYRATRRAIEYREHDPVHAKGKAAPVSVWEVVQARSRSGVDIEQAGAPLVGRRRELGVLADALAVIREERAPQLVTIVGVPGIGKSRLVYELRRIVEGLPELISWRQGRSLPYGEGVTYWALGEMVKAQAGILESDAPEEGEHKLREATAALLADTAEARWVGSQLRPLVGLRGDEEVHAEPRDEGFPAWRMFFEAMAEQRPLVLVFEDLHWADTSLLDFVDYLVEWAIDVPLLAVCTARPELLERRPAWGGGKPNSLTLSLSPLSDTETAQLLAELLQRAVLPAETQTALLARAGGNPLYAEQFVRMLAERGAVRDELPETVQGIIAARLDALAPDEKALLQDAAVVGKVFWAGAVAAIGGRRPSAIEQALHALERKEFVRRERRSAVAGELQLAFRHLLMRDVAYSQIPRAARSQKHERAADWIESLGRPEDHAEMLAHHYLSALEYGQAAGLEDAGLVERARLALRAAGDRALALASYAAAARMYGRALDLWPENDPARVWVLVETGRAKHRADWSGVDFLEKAVEELQSRGDHGGAAEVAVELARFFWIGGDRDRAYAYIDRALELTEGIGHSPARAYALVERAAYHMNASEHEQARHLLREALPLTEKLGIDDLHVRALDVLGSTRGMSGDVRGVDDSKRAISLARDSNAFSRLIIAELNLHVQHFFLGQLDAAWDALHAARRDAESYGSSDQRKWSRIALAHEAFLRGHWDEADRIVNEMIAEIEARAAPYLLDPVCLVLRASIALAHGAVDRASADSEEALHRARTAKDPQILAPALAIRAIVLLVQNRGDASILATEILARGPVLVTALLELHSPVTPIELAWLLRDLGREGELLLALSSAPPSPWLDAATAIAAGDLERAIELVACIGAPPIEAYTRLRAAEQMVAAGHHAEAEPNLEQALAFYRHVGAARYVSQAEAMLGARAQDQSPTS